MANSYHSEDVGTHLDDEALHVISASNPELAAAMEEAGAIPSKAQVKDRAAIFELLGNIILDPLPSIVEDETRRSSTHLVIEPVGSYGLGTWTASSDINCICIGSFSKKTFVSLVLQKLRTAEDTRVRVVRVHQGTKTFVLIVQGVQVDIQYVPSHSLAADWSRASKLPPSHPIWAGLQYVDKLVMKDYWTLEYLRQSLPDIESFQLAHRLLKTWAQRRGIFGLTYLRGYQITIMLASVYRIQASRPDQLSVSNIIALFFRQYSRCDWSKSVVFDPLFHENPNYKRLPSEPVVILGYHSPFAGAQNTMSGCHFHVPQTLTHEFSHAERLLSSATEPWLDMLEQDGAADFLRSHRLYVRIDVQFWGGYLIKGRGYVNWVYSRLPMLLTDIARRLPKQPVRPWPARWTHELDQNAGDDAEEGHYQSCYLIGLHAALNAEAPVDDDADSFEELRLLLQRFENQIRSDKDRFNTQTSHISTSIVSRTDLTSLVVDTRDWTEYTLADAIPDDATPDDDPLCTENHKQDEHLTNPPSRRNKTTTKKSNQPRATEVPRRSGAGRFRTAQEVLHRLRWDPALDSADYIVGYEDRFAGAVERDLDAWRSEQTDEDFVPQHRVLYFRRRGDGVRVWERRTRTDLLFGSG